MHYGSPGETGALDDLGKQFYAACHSRVFCVVLWDSIAMLSRPHRTRSDRNGIRKRL